MTISETLLPEFDHEMESTRKMLSQVPEDKFGWKPHEKSFTLGRLASHVAELGHWAVETITKDSLNIQPGEKPFLAGSKAELMQHFEANAAEARKAIASASDDHLKKNWIFSYGGHKVFENPRVQVLRDMVMSHLIHHRGQLSVYLRMNDVAIPGMYGPSYDDQQSMAQSK